MKFEFDKLPATDSDVIQHHSRSFSMAARLLPQKIRADVEKLYAWCRWCDDAVDEAASPSEAKERLQLLQQDVLRIYTGEATLHPSSQWLASVVNQYGIPQQLPLDLLRGMEADLNNPVFQTIDELLHYCYQAAGTVGLMMSRIMGATDPRALQRAKSLGMAMQLTNIARDIDEDWQSGRRYIPKIWLSLVPQKDVTPTNIQVRTAIENLLSLADGLYDEGYQGLPYLPNGARTAIRLAGRVYQEIGKEIRRQDFRVMQFRVFVPLGRKLILLSRCTMEEFIFRTTRMLTHRLPPSMQTTELNPSFSHRNLQMNYETRYLGYLGISLTFVMATTLFFLMGLNPKEPVYNSLPWLYSGACAVIAMLTGLMARGINRKLQLQPITQTQGKKR